MLKFNCCHVTVFARSCSEWNWLARNGIHLRGHGSPQESVSWADPQAPSHRLTVSQPLSPCHSTLSQFMARKSGLLVHSTGWKEITCEAMARPLSGRHPTVYSEADGKCTARDRSVPHPRGRLYTLPPARPPSPTFLPFASAPQWFLLRHFLSSSLCALQGFPWQALLTKICLK